MLTNQTLATIKTRRSTRNFKGEQITDDELQAVLQAGIEAPNVGNRQAWHFTVIRNKELLGWLNREAKENAKQFDHLREMANNESYDCFYGAPTVILVTGEDGAMAIESDCAAATQNMLLAAESLGLGSCWVDFIILAFLGAKAQQYLQELDA